MSTPTPPPASGPPKLVNLYNVRTVGTPKPCYICSKDTTTCLANADVSDFVYSCTSHLTDRGFASPAPSSSPSSPSPVPQSEIDAVTAAYKAKQASKSTPSTPEKTEEKKGWLATGVSAASSLGSAALSSAQSTASTLFPPPPKTEPPQPVVIPKQVVLHRHVFAMRQEEKKKAWQKAEARKRLEGLQLPSAPRGLPVKK